MHGARWPFDGAVVVLIYPKHRYHIDFQRAPLKCKSRVMGCSVGSVSTNGWGPPKPVFNEHQMMEYDFHRTIEIEHVIL